jgi:hypothetical protein
MLLLLLMMMMMMMMTMMTTMTVTCRAAAGHPQTAKTDETADDKRSRCHKIGH